MFAAGQALLGPPHAHVRGLGLPHAHVKGNEHRACEFAAGRCLQGLCSRGAAEQKEPDADRSKGAEQGLFWAWRDRAGVFLGMAGPATHSFDAHNLRDKTVSACRPRIIGPGVGHARGVDRCQHGHRACGPMPTDPGHKGKAVAMSVQVYVAISRERSGSLCHRACEGVALLLGRWSGPKIFGSRKAGNH